MATSKEGNKQSASRSSQGSGGGTSNRGFASMDPERQRQIASEGGKAAHQKGTAHEFTPEEARRAGSMSHGNRQAAQSGSRAGGAPAQSDEGVQQGNQQGGDAAKKASSRKAPKKAG